MFGPRETTTRFAAGLCLRTSSNWFCFRRRSSLGPGIKNGVCMIWRHNVNSSWINEEYKCKNILHAFFIHHSFAVSFIMDVTPLLWFPSALGWVSSPWCDCIHTSHRIFFWRLKHNVFSPFGRDTRSASDPDVWQMTPSHKHDARENTSSQAACSWKDTQSASRSLAKMKGTRSGDTAAGQPGIIFSDMQMAADAGMCVDALPSRLRCMESGGRHAARLQRRQLPQSSVGGSFQPKH